MGRKREAHTNLENNGARGGQATASRRVAAQTAPPAGAHVVVLRMCCVECRALCGSPETGIWASWLFFASLGRPAALFVRVCRHGSFVESLLSFDLDLSRSILIWLAELRSIGGVLSALGRGVTRVPPPLAVRCLVFSGFVGVACFSSRN